MNSDGLSIIVCCHNSKNLLPKLLEHLAKQVITENISLEIIIVDNASDDGTGDIAKDLWPKDSSISLRVVNEPQLGLSFARERGLKESIYEYVSFIDDDNWLSHNWVSTVYHVMKDHPDVGICGGRNLVKTQIETPWWFEEFQEAYAIGSQAEKSGDVTDRGFVWGAGLTLRKSVWQKLTAQGFKPYLMDRQGKSLSSGGDSELCHAFVLAGWKLWYQEDLVLTHYLPENRLNWHYLKKMVRAFGVSDAILHAYRQVLKENLNPNTENQHSVALWMEKVDSILQLLIPLEENLIDTQSDELEGNPDVLMTERLHGALFKFLEMKEGYDEIVVEIRELHKRIRSDLILVNNLPAPPKGEKDWPWTEGCKNFPEKMSNGASWPRISIVTPSYNQGLFLEETIRSVILQNYPNLEYIIIDGGSTDESVEIIKKYDKWIDYWVSEPDEGQPSAINKGFEHATGEIYAWINSDDVYKPYTFSKVADFFSDNPDIGLVYAQAEVIDENSKVTGIIGLEWDLETQITKGNLPPQPSTFFTADAFKMAGKINHNYQYSFDYYLWINIGFVKNVRFVKDIWSQFRLNNNTKSGRGRLPFELEELEIYKELLNLEIPIQLDETELLANQMLKISKAYYWNMDEQNILHWANQSLLLRQDVERNAKAVLEHQELFDEVNLRWAKGVTELSTNLEARDQAINRLNAKLAEREQEIHRLNAKLAEREQEIHRLKLEIVKKENEVLYYALSKSWVITRPLRKIMKFTKRLFRKEI